MSENKQAINRPLLSLVLIGLLIGVGIGILRPKAPAISSYQHLQAIQYIGELHLVNYTSEEILTVYSEPGVEEQAERILGQIEILEANLMTLAARKEALAGTTDSRTLERLETAISFNQGNKEKLEQTLEELDKKVQLTAFTPVNITAYTDLTQIKLPEEGSGDTLIWLPAAQLSEANVLVEDIDKSYQTENWMNIIREKDGEKPFHENLVRSIQALELYFPIKARLKKMERQCDSLAKAYVENLLGGIKGPKNFVVRVEPRETESDSLALDGTISAPQD
ncbi:MAG: hypothetical protein AAFR61_03430 [Bacteroidota bacterium]